MEFAVEPVERRAHIFEFALAIVVLTLAQAGPAKIEAKHWISKAVQRFHGMEYNLVVQRAAIHGMGMAHQSCVGRVLRAEVQNCLKLTGGAIEKERANCAGGSRHYRSIIAMNKQVDVEIHAGQS